MDGGVRGVIRNNLLYANHASGISLYRSDAGAGASGNLVVNNTVVNAADGRWCLNINNGSTGNTVRNNIFYTFHDFRGAIAIDASSRPGFTSDYNSVMSRFSTNGGGSVIGLAAWQALGYDQHSLVGTPGDHFLVPGSDFHLRADSPAVDAGTAAGAPVTDLEGQPRPVGAGVDLGAYETQLLACGDGAVDPGEQCGEPGLGCLDPCTSCRRCVCATNPPVCGDGLVCAGEGCEDDGDCGGGLVCLGCQCGTPSLCASGIGLRKPKQTLRAAPGRLRVKAEAVLPLPWAAVDPPARGIRVLIDAVASRARVDVALPGGAGWSVKGAGTKWTYRDPSGAVVGVTKAVVQNRTAKEPGLLQVSVKGRGGTLVLPDPAQARTTVVFGGPTECAEQRWGPPGGSRPRCDGDPTRLSCK
jgi:hypothetical protein